MLEAVRSGRSASEIVHGKTFFSWLAIHPDAEQLFDDAMTIVSALANPAIAAAYDFSPIQMLVDVGGGQGSLLGTILAGNPLLRGTIFDLPSVIARARREPGLQDPAIA